MRYCPYCGCSLKTIDTRAQIMGKIEAEHGTTRRRKECKCCHKRYTTYEVFIEDIDLMVERYSNETIRGRVAELLKAME